MHQIIRRHPELVVRVLQGFGFDFPEPVDAVVLPDSDFEVMPPRYRSDTVLRIDSKSVQGPCLVGIDVQDTPDPDKHFRWPLQITALLALLHLPAILVVLTQDRETAEWAEQPIVMATPLGTSMMTQPLVVGPHNLPLPAGDIAEDELPMAAFAAVIHGQEEEVDCLLGVLAEALNETDEVTRTDLSLYIESGLAGLPSGETWRKLMSFTREKLSKSPALRETADQDCAA